MDFFFIPSDFKLLDELSKNCPLSALRMRAFIVETCGRIEIELDLEFISFLLIDRFGFFLKLNFFIFDDLVTV